MSQITSLFWGGGGGGGVMESHTFHFDDEMHSGFLFTH